jgi:hypothetical protein
MPGVHLPEKIHPADVRHAIVRDHNVEMPFAELVECGHAVLCRDDIVPFPLEYGTHMEPGTMVVINDEHPLAIPVHARPPP